MARFSRFSMYPVLRPSRRRTGVGGSVLLFCFIGLVIWGSVKMSGGSETSQAPSIKLATNPAPTIPRAPDPGPAIPRATDPASEAADRMMKAENLVIDYGPPKQFKLPSHPNTEIFRDSLWAEQTDVAHAQAALDGIDIALRRYPTGFVGKLVRALFIPGVLHSGNGRASGTLGEQWIVVAAPVDRDVDDVRAMSTATLHHELSSAVLRREGALTRWTAFWPPNLPELQNFDLIAAQNSGATPDPTTGLLSAFALTNPENDFNVYAEEVFLHPQELERLAASTPLVRRKLNSLIELYVLLDPRMTARFQEMGVSTPAP